MPNHVGGGDGVDDGLAIACVAVTFVVVED